MENSVLYDITAASEQTLGDKLINAIINGLGKFGRSLGTLAQGLMDDGYDINKVTRGPQSTVWLIGNDKYKQTQGKEGYLCQVTIAPHPIQKPGSEPTYSVEVKTVEGLSEHSFVIENVTQSQVSEAVKSTMLAWDAQDNKTEESIQTYATALANKDNKFMQEVQTRCDELKEEIGDAEEVQHFVQEADNLKKETVGDVQNLHKRFLRALRDAKTADDKISTCKSMDDELNDTVEEFNSRLDDLKEAVDKFPSDSAEPDNAVAESIHPASNQILAAVTKSQIDGEPIYILNRIAASYDPSIVKEALETVLYDASVAETIPEDAECVLQLTEEPDSWDVEMLSQQTTLDIRDVCVEILKTLYIALFNTDAIYFNSYGLDFPQLFESIDPARDIIKGLTFIVSRICAEQTHFWPQPLTYLTPDNLLDPSAGFTAESGLIALSDVINKVVECVDLYRCNFSEFDQSQIITDINNLNVINSQIALKLQK